MGIVADSGGHTSAKQKPWLPVRELFGLCIPLALAVVAAGCGWFGISQGFVLGLWFPIALLLFAALYGLRAGLLLRKAWRPAVLIFLLMFACIGGFYVFFIFHWNPFLGAFKARIWHEYGNHIPEIQAWATTSLKTAKHETYSLDETNWPSWVKIRDFPEPRVVISNEENMAGRESLSIAWGGGMAGGWGLIVGNPTLQLKYEKWADGVYFFIGQ